MVVAKSFPKYPLCFENQFQKDFSRTAFTGFQGPSKMTQNFNFISMSAHKNEPEYCKPVFFACPLFREFREPGKFVKIEYSSVSV